MKHVIFRLLVDGKINRDEYRSLMLELAYRESMGEIQKNQIVSEKSDRLRKIRSSRQM